MTDGKPGDIDAAKLDAQLCFALYNATNAVIRSYNSRLRLLGMEYEQYLVMMCLWQDGSTSIDALAERLFIEPATITRHVEHLERAGFLARGDDTKAVTLTEDGIALEGAVYDVQQAVKCSIDMSDETLQSLHTELQTLLRQISRSEARNDTKERPDAE